MPKNILLTGATGFLGSKLLEELLKYNYKVYILLRKQSDVWRIKHLEQKYFSFVLENNKTHLDKIFFENEIDTIIHTATDYGRTKEWSDIYESNIVMPLQLLEAGCRNKLKLFINTDSFFSKPNIVSTYLEGYTSSKKIFLNALLQTSNKIKIANLRLEHVFGKDDSEGKFITSLLKDLRNNKLKIDLSAGKQKRDFVYLPDVVNAYMKVLLDKKIENGFTEYQIGTGSSISVKEFVKKLAKHTLSTSILNFGTIPTRVDEIKDSKADINNIKKIGWLPKYTIDEAIKDLVSS